MFLSDSEIRERLNIPEKRWPTSGPPAASRNDPVRTASERVRTEALKTQGKPLKCDRSRN